MRSLRFSGAFPPWAPVYAHLVIGALRRVLCRSGAFAPRALIHAHVEPGTLYALSVLFWHISTVGTYTRARSDGHAACALCSVVVYLHLGLLYAYFETDTLYALSAS